MKMITPGTYSVWFKTPAGEGAALVEFYKDGTLSGGDSTFTYIGRWSEEGEKFRATLTAKRVKPGPPGVFGMDEIDVKVAGQSKDDGSTYCSGFAKQTPGIKLEVIIYRAC